MGFLLLQLWKVVNGSPAAGGQYIAADGGGYVFADGSAIFVPGWK
jgi:hypothetical protein